MAARVTSERLVGRDAELAELRDALGAAAAGRASLVLLSGESGVGKTRLLGELSRAAREDGALVLCGDSVELGDGELPYAPLVSALRPLVRDADDVFDELAPQGREALARLLPGLPGGGATLAPAQDAAAQAHLFEAVLDLLDALGARRPVLLVLEDVHWADRSTRAFLAFLGRSLGSERVLAVASYRSDELHRRHPLRPLLAELSPARRVELEPLDAEALEAAVEEILGAPPAPELMRRLWARSEGNPLFMEELLATGADGRGALPATLRDALMVRVERASEDAQEVLRLLAVAERPDHELLEQAGELEPRALREALREAVAAHLVVAGAEGTYTFRHALQREVVADDLLPGERSELHRRIAEALERRAQEPGAPGHLLRAAIALHRLGAGDRPAALRASITAARAAECVHAHGEAAALLERALELFEQVPGAEELVGTDRVGLLVQAADEHLLADDRGRAEGLLEAALAALDPERDRRRFAAALARLSRVQWTLSRSDAALQTAGRGLELLPEGEPSEERAALTSWWAKMRMLQGRYRDALRIAQEAAAVAEQAADDASRARARDAMGVSLMALGQLEEGGRVLREAIAAARELDRPQDLASAYTNLADSLHLWGRSREALQVAEEGLGAISAAGAYSSDWLALQAAEIAFDLGDWSATAARLPAHAERRYTGSMLLHVLLRHGELALGRGEHDRAAAVLERAAGVAEGSREPQVHGPLGALLAELRRREGDLDAARRAVDDALDRIEFCTEDVARIARVSAAGVAVEADRAQRARDLGEPDAERDAVAYADLYLARVVAAAQEGGPVEAAWETTARAEHARATGAPDPGAWSAAVEAWTGVERPYGAALAHWRRAEAHLAAGERAGAAAAAQEALALALKIEAPWLGGEVEGLLLRARLRPAEAAADATPATDGDDDPFGLTPRERQVLALVARGATNREIGAELFMAEKTASVHVSRILAKLDVKSRTQAAALAHRLGLEG
jgi:DNA-binding CsgD family transcriptional regulator